MERGEKGGKGRESCMEERRTEKMINNKLKEQVQY